MARLDVNYLHRNGMLNWGWSGTLTWSQGGDKVGSIGVRGGGDRVTLHYTYRGDEDIVQDVMLTHTPCHYGGERPWFVCPNCSKRVGTIMGGRTFACRTCLGLVYYSQQCDVLSRLIHRKHKLERKLEHGGLHYKTVDRLCAQLGHLDQRIDEGIYARFGCRM